jgi:D-galacturonate reductase
VSNITKQKDKLNVLVVGAGMYVSGRNTPGYGTILPALNDLHIKGIINQIFVASTSHQSIILLKEKLNKLRKITNSDLRIKGLPEYGENPSCYLEAIELYNLDCAIVAVPDQFHYEIVSNLIQSKIHVLVVKPLTPTLSKSKELIKLTKTMNVYGLVEFHKRLDHANLKIKDSIDSGLIGDLLYVHVEYSQRRSIPSEIFSKWVEGTNIFQYLGVHYVDIIYFVTGYLPKRLVATGQKKLLINLGIDTYDSIQVLIEWENNEGNTFASTFLTNWIDPNTTSAMSDQSIKIIGSNGRIESDQKNRGVQIVTEDQGIEDVNPYFNQDYSVPGQRKKVFKGYGISSIKQFCFDVLNLKQNNNSISDFDHSRPTFSESIYSTSVIESVSKSLDNNSKWIIIKI